MGKRRRRRRVLGEARLALSGNVAGPGTYTCSRFYACTFFRDAEVSAMMEYEKKIAARRVEVARLQQQRDSLLSAQARLKQVQELMTQVWNREGYGGWMEEMGGGGGGGGRGGGGGGGRGGGV